MSVFYRKGKPNVGRRYWFAKPASPWALEDRTLSLPFVLSTNWLTTDKTWEKKVP